MFQTQDEFEYPTLEEQQLFNQILSGLSGLSGFDGKVNVNDTDVDERTSGDEGNKVVEKKKQYWW